MNETQERCHPRFDNDETPAWPEDTGGFTESLVEIPRQFLKVMQSALHDENVAGGTRKG